MTINFNRTNASYAKIATAQVALKNALYREAQCLKKATSHYGLVVISALVLFCFLYSLLETAFQTPTGESDGKHEIFKAVGAGFTMLAMSYIRTTHKNWTVVCYMCLVMPLCYASFSGLLNRLISDIPNPNNMMAFGAVAQSSAMFEWGVAIFRIALAVGIAFVVYLAENAIWLFFEKAASFKEEAARCREFQNEASIILELANSSKTAWDNFQNTSKRLDSFTQYRNNFLASEIRSNLDSKIIDLNTRRSVAPDPRTVPQSRLDTHFISQEALQNQINDLENQKEKIGVVIDLYTKHNPV